MTAVTRRAVFGQTVVVELKDVNLGDFAPLSRDVSGLILPERSIYDDAKSGFDLYS